MRRVGPAVFVPAFVPASVAASPGIRRHEAAVAAGVDDLPPEPGEPRIPLPHPHLPHPHLPHPHLPHGRRADGAPRG